VASAGCQNSVRKTQPLTREQFFFVLTVHGQFCHPPKPTDISVKPFDWKPTGRLCQEDRKLLFSLEKLMIYVYMFSLHVLLVCFGKPITSKKIGSSDSQSKRDWPLVYDFAAGLIDPRKNSRHFKLDLSEF
jgi:hypothetical protein